MGGHPDEVDLTGGDLDEEQHIDLLEQYGVDGEEIASQHRARLDGQELFPRRSCPPRRGVDPGVVEDLPHGAGRHPVAQPDQLTATAIRLLDRARADDPNEPRLVWATSSR